MPAAVTAKEFLEALWGDQVGIAELTTITPKAVKPQRLNAFGFMYPGALDAFITSALAHNSRELNVYMGVCLRREQWPQGGRGTEALALSTNAVWVDLDFKDGNHKGRTVDPEAARKMLAEFPKKPSIIVKSGGGIHVYWLLKEAAVGAELHTAKKVNRALNKYFGGDPVQDMARILRLPDTANYNCTPPVKAQVSWWHTEFRYLLDDFDFLPQADDPLASAATAATPASGQSWVEGTPPPPSKTAAADSGHEPRPTPTTPLDEDVCRMMGKLFADIWFEGYRHEMALCVGGWLAFAGIKLEHAVDIVRIASDIKKGDTVKRIKDVTDTYAKFVTGGEVKGRPTLETMVDEAFPQLSKDKAKKTLEAIQKLMPRPKGLPSRGLAEADFKILWLTKYTSSPPVWTVTLEKEGKKIITKTEHSRFMKYEVFVEDVCDQNTLVPQAALKNPQWRGMINEARRNGLYDEQVAPPESRPAGAIEKGLEEFLAEGHYNPDIGIMKKFAGYDDDYTFIRLETFREFLKEQGRPFTPSQLTEKLKAMGWESRVRRFGKKTPHVWIKALLKGGGHDPGNGGGNGNGNGHSPNPKGPASNPDSEIALPKADELFPSNQEKAEA